MRVDGEELSLFRITTDTFSVLRVSFVACEYGTLAPQTWLVARLLHGLHVAIIKRSHHVIMEGNAMRE